ncbi:phosphonate utilization transcriptional regulator PhnR [Psychromonas marina]|uniref:Phosphonate utilization transcriptional regulator PhnR n=1 Tax=Psychromonas marina TaxID=88364 RepID=A0ABQ6E2D9_9GAMM|nr:phosphonate utilization transcriptional regulator PhnR [Psychromonas marina]GLS91574.1 phosphonate utilization transcriptional regulator PhnR [Psychromonas marina]
MQYLKIKEILVEQIETGLLQARQKLPSERKMAEAFSTTRVTLREALGSLEAEARLYREDRRGWFVCPKPLRYDPRLTLNFVEMAKQQGREAVSELIFAKQTLATKKTSKLLQVTMLTELYHLARVRYLEQRPVVYVVNYIKAEYFKNLFDHDYVQSLTTTYQQHYSVSYQRTHYRVSTTSLFGDIAQALRATSGSPAMLVERTNYDQQGRLIDCDLEYWRHDAICIESVAELIEVPN